MASPLLGRLSDSKLALLQLLHTSPADIGTKRFTGRFWRRALKFATPQAQSRFKDVFSRYVRSLVEQSKIRDDGGFCSVDEYMMNRRLDVGTDPCYAIAELKYGLPQEVFDHPLLREASACVTDLVILDNVRSSSTHCPCHIF